jgi:amidohydrolase
VFRRLRPRLHALSRRIFDLAELSLEETRSAAALCRFLRSEGFAVRRGAGGLPTAFVARRCGRGGKRPRIAFLAEYDALPGVGHACGHNLIGAAACGAAAVAGRLLDGRAGTILVIGTPAEETIGGKVALLRRGVFAGLDAALMFHPSTENRVRTTSLACHSLEVVFTGRESHAVASPEKGINALTALLRLFALVEALRPALPEEVRMPGIVVDGGRRANIVPARAVGRFSLRAGSLRSLRAVERAFRSAARTAAASVGARVTLRSIDLPYAAMRTNQVMADIFKEELRALGRKTVDTPRKGMGSLDMGNLRQVVPSIHPYVAAAPRSAPLHSPAFALRAGGREGRAALDAATRALAATALRLVEEPALLSRARRELRRARRSGS